MNAHTCHAPRCRRVVPPKMFMCKPHWFKLRQKVRDAIWREYRSGQEKDKRPSVRYLAVQQLAMAEIVFESNDEKAAYESAVLLRNAITFREKAIAEGVGDPLAGLVP